MTEPTVPSVPVESGDTTSYRARLTSKLSKFLLWHTDDVTQLVDAVLAVRDTEMERLREQLAYAVEMVKICTGHPDRQGTQPSHPEMIGDARKEADELRAQRDKYAAAIADVAVELGLDGIPMIDAVRQLLTELRDQADRTLRDLVLDKCGYIDGAEVTAYGSADNDLADDRTTAVLAFLDLAAKSSYPEGLLQAATAVANPDGNSQ